MQSTEWTISSDYVTPHYFKPTTQFPHFVSPLIFS